jgi:chitinase
VFRSGLSAAGVFVLRNAIASGVHINLVNILAFDYYRGKKTNMGTSAVGAAVGVHNQLHHLLPRDSAVQLWRKEGITLLPGIDDAGSTETTTTRDAAHVMKFAVGKHLGLLSIWALQRDNGGCRGTPDSNTCSGISQAAWAFSHLLEHFTG